MTATLNRSRLALLAALLLALGGAHADDDDDQRAAPARATRVDGASAIRLTPAEQKQTGLQLMRLEATTFQPESLAAGRVVDLAPLLEARSVHGAARAEAAVARAAGAASALEVQRLRTLHAEDGNVSARELERAEATAAADRARLAAAQRQVDDLAARTAQQWGPQLAAVALRDGDAALARLIQRQEVLLLVTLRRGETLPAAVKSIRVGPSGERAATRRATLVSAAPGTDPVTQGETYFFRCDAARLRTGMRVDAWIPHPGKAARGVEVPGSAVLWYANRLWVYVKSGDDLFVRRPLLDYAETADGWFVSRGVGPGEHVVLRGAQMLLSEEFRAVIPDEDASK